MLPTSKGALPLPISPLSKRYSEMMSSTMEAKNSMTRFFDIFHYYPVKLAWAKHGQHRTKVKGHFALLNPISLSKALLR